MNTEQLETFLALAETKNFSRAAAYYLPIRREQAHI